MWKLFYRRDIERLAQRYGLEAGLLNLDPRIGEVYLSAEEIAARVRELGAELARDYANDEPILVASLKASVVFVTDLSRATQIPHALDFVELPGTARTPRPAATAGSAPGRTSTPASTAATSSSSRT